ncbi:MAG TPA: SGNH/GDSL hydrolase family protein [Sphingomonas sp.]|nr:SGNH/GDSL hydrolase family protein [Sphingomonas sp.]
MKRFAFAAAGALALAAAAPASAAAFTKFVVFGDSFLDAGNVQAAVGPIFTDPQLGYWQGRFSNGPNWIDYLSYASYGMPTTASLLGGTNFAVGGARASGDDVQALGTIPGLPSQLDLYTQYLMLTGQAFDPDALYVINFGNNDVNYIQALLGAGNPLAAAGVAAAYVFNMTHAVLRLRDLGARTVLLAGVPNPTEVEGQALQAALDASLDAITPALGSTKLVRFDYFNYYETLLADPTAVGLPATLNLTVPCLAAEPPSPSIDCHNYLSFDGTHVTKGVQASISFQIAHQLGIAAIPEPASWAMMVAGFAAAGAAFRRGRRRTALVQA